MIPRFHAMYKIWPWIGPKLHEDAFKSRQPYVEASRHNIYIHAHWPVDSRNILWNQTPLIPTPVVWIPFFSCMNSLFSPQSRRLPKAPPPSNGRPMAGRRGLHPANPAASLSLSHPFLSSPCPTCWGIEREQITAAADLWLLAVILWPWGGGGKERARLSSDVRGG